MIELERTEEAAGLSAEPTKTRLLEAAGEEFSARGYEGATIRSIAQRAGANIAAVNYHFGDKESLYVQVVLHAHRSAVPHEPHEMSESLSPPDRLRTWIAQMLRQVLGMEAYPTWHHDVMMREMLRPTRASETLVREVIGPRFQRLRSIIAAICPGLDARALHAFCFSVVGQCLFYKMTRDMASRLIGREAFGALDQEYLARHISGVMLAALEQWSPTEVVADAGSTPAGPESPESNDSKVRP
jgi:AcrR family transcriptional regulator